MTWKHRFWLVAAWLAAGCMGSVSPGASPGTVTGAGGSGPEQPGPRPPGGGAGTGMTPATGGSGAAPTPPASGEVTPFSCNPQAAGRATGWRRLGAGQYRNSLRDLLVFALRDGNAAGAVMNAVTGELGRLPADERQKLPQDLHGSYRRLDQDVEQLHVEASYEVGLAVAANLTAPTRLGVVAGSCATDGNAANDADCLGSFVQRFGARALRRPLAADEVTLYRGLYGPTPGSDPAGYADVITGLLTAPQFLYQVEHGGAPVSGAPGRFTLDPYELASRLSYHFWDTMPDEALWTAAASGALATAAGYRAEVERLLGDARARTTMDGFVRDWLKLDDLPALDARNGHPAFKAFAGADLPRPSLRNEMMDDVLGMVRFYLWDRRGTLEDLLTSELSFARGADLARLYGMPVWDGGAAPPAFAPGLRPGLFTRAAFLATGSPTTRPVMKGVFLRSNVLCDSIPPPPDNAMANLPQLDPKLSTRQTVEAITEAPGSACASCHTGYINPLGFATENFDALGRARTSQPVFDEAGAEIARAPVDTRSVPRIDPGDTTAAAGAADVMRLVAASGKAHACLARHVFRFSFGRWEDLDGDGCLLERLRQLLMRKTPLAEVMREIALSPEFQQRATGAVP